MDSVLDLIVWLVDILKENEVSAFFEKFHTTGRKIQTET